jgi:hypothetical protein
MNEAQLNILIEQNARLLEQNQQLIAKLSANDAPVVIPRPKTPGKKERIGYALTSWYGSLQKTLDPVMAAILKEKLIKKGLWQA